jgi:peptidoglycan hydrolase-like protein with peptidoglycan-binding domain
MPNRISERDFVARHSFQRLATADASAEPALSGANVPAADVDNDGAIQGEPELKNLYAKLLALDTSSSSSTGVDLDAPGVKPVYNALTMRFTQKVGTEASLGSTKRLGEVAELRAVRDGASVLARVAGTKQLGVGSVQDALLVVAAAEEARTGRASLLRVNLGAGGANRGLFGPGTEGAVSELQRQVGLQVTGKIDANTLLALDNELVKARTPVTPPVVTPPVVTPPVTPPTGTVAHPRFASIAAFADVAAARTVMRAGDTGPAVAALQQALLDMGFNMMSLRNDVGVSGVDGAWGDQTTTALKNFQIHAKKKHPSVAVNGNLDAATLRALEALAPAPGKKAWETGEPNHAPVAKWNGTQALRIVTVKDEHRTFLFDTSGKCTGIFANAHGTAGSETDTGLKKIRTKLDEPAAQATGTQLWGTPRAFGQRILDLQWASGSSSGEELHGTFDYRNMGKNVSHGCVRHYNEDIITMFNAVSVGEHVAIVTSVDDPMLRA